MERHTPGRSASRSTDIGLRVAGLPLLALSWFAIDALVAARAHAAGAPADAFSYGLAALGFVAGDLGAILLGLGGHIFDQVEISARWAKHPVAQRHAIGPSHRIGADEPGPSPRGPARGGAARSHDRDARDAPIFPARLQAQR